MTWDCENSGSEHSEESDIEEEAEQGNHFVKKTTLELRNELLVELTKITGKQIVGIWKKTVKLCLDYQ
jgi:hypothetical protein